MRLLAALIGYVCTATVITACLCVGYLWREDRLTDEKMFRIVAILHDIDIDKLAKEEETEEQAEAPPQETSLGDVERTREILARDFEVKQEQLTRGRQVFDYSYSRLREEMARFDQLAGDLDRRLREEGESARKLSVSRVVRDLELLGPTEAKNLLRATLAEPDGVENVITLMNTMSGSKLKKILSQFQTQEELDDLHAIHRLMMQGGPQKEVLDRALEELSQLQNGQP